MNTKVEKLEGNIVKLEVTVPVESFQKAIQKAYKKNGGKYSVPGFRKGKTPLHILEKYYGESLFFEDAVGEVYEETYPVVLDENDIKPIDYPEIDIVQIGKDKEFVYSAKVTVKPEATLGQYKGIEVKKNVYTVSDEDVDLTLNSMRDKNARIISKEDGAVENGDTAIINFEGFVDGVAFEGGKGEGYELVIGSGTFIPGFEEQLVGAKVNEEKDVNVSFPEDYHAEDLKGKPALFKVTVTAIKTKELPELDDEFVKDVSEFDTVDELKADIRSKQEAGNAEKAKKEYEDELLKTVSEAATVEIPQVMVEREIDYMIKDLDYRLQYQGLNVEKYAELIGSSMEAMRADFSPIASDKVKLNLVLEAIAKAENITATEQEMEEKADEIAKKYGSKDVEKMKAAILATEKANLTEDIVNEKVVALLVKESKEIA